MRTCGIAILLLLGASTMAQTGPGGVGSSTNNVLWLRANSGITHSGGAVSQWNDQSGNGNHAYLPGSIPTATPSLVTNSVNGYPSLDFDGVDDQLWVNDASTLDLTQWHIYIVVTADLQKDFNAWMVKGNDNAENYEMLSYGDGNMHTPIRYTDNTRTAPNSASNQVTTTAFDVFEYSYNASVGRDVYKNATTIITDNESKTPQVNNLPLYIANERNTSGRNVNGDIAEVIAYNAPLNSAQRIIVNNYLAAKYGRSLGVNDIYVQDNAGNGNYDHDVAGIGRVNGSNMQTESRGSGIVQISKAGHPGLQNNEFLLWGHDNAELDAWGVADFPPTIQGRVARVWRVNEVSTAGTAVDVGNVDITFDLAGLGPASATDLRLLVDTDNDGLFADETPIAGATNPSGTLYLFAGVSALANELRFTIGTANAFSTPLPVELLAFDAEAVGPGQVRTTWSTASELNNERFIVERSSNMVEWTEAGEVPGAGNSTEVLHYAYLDEDAEGEVLYFRLRQIDTDGTFSLSAVRVVHMPHGAQGLQLYPNPCNGRFTLVWPVERPEVVRYVLIDAAGRSSALAPFHGAGPEEHFEAPPLAAGIYRLLVMADGRSLASLPVVIH